MEMIGLVLLFIGGSAMDSENMFFPAAMVIVGIALMARKGAKGWK